MFHRHVAAVAQGQVTTVTHAAFHFHLEKQTPLEPSAHPWAWSLEEKQVVCMKWKGTERLTCGCLSLQDCTFFTRKEILR